VREGHEGAEGDAVSGATFAALLRTPRIDPIWEPTDLRGLRGSISRSVLSLCISTLRDILHRDLPSYSGLQMP
jgi:hypothetical protein